METEPRSPWYGRIALLGLFALFFVPVLGAIMIFMVNPQWVPFGRVNRGELITPPRQLDFTGMQAIHADRALPELVDGHWTLLYHAPAACPDPCTMRLTAMHQARLALGKDADRIVRLWLVRDWSGPVAVKPVLDRFPGLLAAQVGPGLASQLSDVSPDAIYVLDPARFLILRYSGADTAADIHKDMKRLLKISKQG